YHKSTYVPGEMILAAAGSVNFFELQNELEKLLAKRKFRAAPSRIRRKPKLTPFRKTLHKSSEQVHLSMGFEVSSFRDEDRFDAFIVNALLGGGMTSRLFQEVREKRGLVYSIYSSLNTFTDYGMLLIYA